MSIFVQIGTEEKPFCRRAIITLHGNVVDPEIPIYGAKVIGVRQGELDFHGCRRNITWTRLADTSLNGSSILHLQVISLLLFLCTCFSVYFFLFLISVYY